MEQSLIFLDLETTGHDPIKRIDNVKNFGSVLVPWHEIIEIGALAVSTPDSIIRNTFEIKVAPKHPERCMPNLINHYPERAAAGEWDEAVSLEEAISSLLAFCANFDLVHLIGQNFFFDWSFLSVAFAECGIGDEVIQKHIHYKKMDIASMAVQELLDSAEAYDPKNFSLRSGLMQKHLDIKPEPTPHTALNGAYQAYNTFVALQELRLRRQ